jgi:hypothetical protein
MHLRTCRRRTRRLRRRMLTLPHREYLFLALASGCSRHTVAVRDKWCCSGSSLALAHRLRPPKGFKLSCAAGSCVATRIVARRLPRIPLDSDARSAAAETPRRWCSGQALQRRIEAGPARIACTVSSGNASARTPTPAFAISNLPAAIPITPSLRSLQWSLN